MLTRGIVSMAMNRAGAGAAYRNAIFSLGSVEDVRAQRVAGRTSSSDHHLLRADHGETQGKQGRDNISVREYFPTDMAQDEHPVAGALTW
jgi:hypothetical protein